MKISVDDVELFTLSETQESVIKYDINEDIFDEDMKRRLQWVLTHKYENVFQKLKNDWLPILQTRYESIPTNSDALAILIFSQPDYKSRKDRDLESTQLSK